jgi:hypothetical protein
MRPGYKIDTVYTPSLNHTEEYCRLTDGDIEGPRQDVQAQVERERLEGKPVHKGFTIVRRSTEYIAWAIEHPDGTPDDLSGIYTSRNEARRAIDVHLGDGGKE